MKEKYVGVKENFVESKKVSEND